MEKLCKTSYQIPQKSHKKHIKNNNQNNKNKQTNKQTKKWVSAQKKIKNQNQNQNQKKKNQKKKKKKKNFRKWQWQMAVSFPTSLRASARASSRRFFAAASLSSLSRPACSRAARRAACGRGWGFSAILVPFLAFLVIFHMKIYMKIERKKK
jgi:cation transport ATPase